MRYENNHNLGQNSSQPQYAPRPDKPQGLEEIVKNLAMSTQQLTASTHNFQVQIKTRFSELADQINKLTTSVNKLENKEKLSSQLDINPRQNASAIALRSGKEIPSAEKIPLPLCDHATVRETEKETPKSSKEAPVMMNPERPPFPQRLAKKKKILDD